MTIAYICNQENECCKKIGCVKNGGECSHTTNIKYSKNFKEVPIVENNPKFTKFDTPHEEVRYIEEGN